MNELKPPKNLFCLIEAAIDKRPARLSMDHYHELHGREAVTAGDIRNQDCKHCLFGWVIAMCDGAPSEEPRRDVRGQDPVQFANEILVLSGRLPLLTRMAFGGPGAAMAIIRHRAAQERAAQGVACAVQ